MSSYIVEHSTINRVMMLLIVEDPDLTMNRDVLGQNLLNMNVDATSQRYPSGVFSTGAEPYKFQPVFGESIHQLHKSLTCFLYQCGEGNVPERALFKRLQRVQDKYNHLENDDEWEDAEWG